MPIVKLSTGKGAGGLMKYLQQGRKGVEPDRASAWQTNLPGEDRQDWALFFAQQRALNDRVQLPYLHLSVSFDPNDPDQVNLSDEQILAFGESYLKRMELHEHQWVMAVHRDRDHPHVHIVVNRIGDDGKPYDLWHSAMRFREGLRDVETDHGLSPPRELNRPYQPDRGELHRPERDGELTWKLELTTRINDAIQTTDGTWDKFVSELQRDHVDLKLNPNGRGISFALLDRTDKEGNPIRIKASTLGKRYRMDGLKERLSYRANERVLAQSDPERARQMFEPNIPRDKHLGPLALESEHERGPTDLKLARNPSPPMEREHDAIGMFGGIPYRGLQGLNREERRDYTRVMNLYVVTHRDHPAYQRADGNSARQALAIERDFRALVHGRIVALAPEPELVEQMQSLAYTARHLTSPQQALDLGLNRLISRSIAKTLDAAPALVPLAIAVLVTKDVLGALNEASLSEQEKVKQAEEEHSHDREWQFTQANQHEYERER